jgi:small-conductance mechanosensitive channel
MTTVITTGDETPATQGEVLAAETAAVVAEVAQIEADRDVAIAEIQAETQEAAIEAAAEIAEDQEENSEWRRNIEATQATLATQCANLSEQLSSIQTQLTKLAEPPASLPPSESAAETPASQEVPVEPVRRKKPFRWI